MNILDNCRAGVMRLALTLMAAVALAACNTIPVATDYDPGWTLPSGASFAWIERKGGEGRDPFVDSDLVQTRVERAVDEQLRAQGLQRVDSAGEAQLLVAYHIGEEERIDIDTFHSWYGYYPCWGCYGAGYWPRHGYGHGYGYDPFGPDIWVREYTQGKLMVDLVDAQSRKLVWRGVAERRMPTLRTPAERDAYIRETVAAIFQKFPPGAVR